MIKGLKVKIINKHGTELKGYMDEFLPNFK